MSDSSEDEDLSRFQEAVDSSFTKLIDESRGIETSSKKDEKKLKSERYLDTASHYNDVKVPKQMQKQIGAKLSAVISESIEFVDVQENGVKKSKVKGGVKLFSTSEDYLSCETEKDTYTEMHNREAKKLKKKRRNIDEVENANEEEKVNAVVVSGEYVLSKEEIKSWKSRRKEKLYKYKKEGKNRILTATE